MNDNEIEKTCKNCRQTQSIQNILNWMDWLSERSNDFLRLEDQVGNIQNNYCAKCTRNPNRVTCTCCGEDYSVSEHENLEQATAYERECRSAWFDKHGKEIPQEEAWVPGKGCVDGAYGKYVEEQRVEYSHDPYRTLEEYLKDPSALFIFAKDIKPSEQKGQLRKEGYVWLGEGE